MVGVAQSERVEIQVTRNSVMASATNNREMAASNTPRLTHFARILTPLGKTISQRLAHIGQEQANGFVRAEDCTEIAASLRVNSNSKHASAREAFVKRERSKKVRRSEFERLPDWVQQLPNHCAGPRFEFMHVRCSHKSNANTESIIVGTIIRQSNLSPPPKNTHTVPFVTMSYSQITLCLILSGAPILNWSAGLTRPSQLDIPRSA